MWAHLFLKSSRFCAGKRDKVEKEEEEEEEAANETYFSVHQ